MKNILLIGIGRFGKHLAMQLHDLGHEVMAVDQVEERINDVLDIVTGAQIGDSTNEAFLSSLDIKNYDVLWDILKEDIIDVIPSANTYVVKESLDGEEYLGKRYIIEEKKSDSI